LSMLIVLILSSLGLAIAQADVMGTPDMISPWLKAGVAVCSLAALIWVVQHLLRTTIPEQGKNFRETLDKISERSERHDQEFREAMVAHTDRCRETQQRWVDQVRRTE